MLTKTLIKLNLQILNNNKKDLEMSIESCKKYNSSYSNKIIDKHEKKIKDIDKIIYYYKNILEE